MTGALIEVGSALVLGLGVPWVGMRMLAPSLAEGRVVENYRGRRVFLGLGVVWLLWAGAAILEGVFVAGPVLDSSVSVLPVLTLAGPLALVAFSLGLVDDAFGTSGAKGFRGHLAALRRGRLTTGGAKLFGISLASLFVALVFVEAAPWGVSPDAVADGPLRAVGLALVAGAAIALTSNFVNLVDLRPGRALKVYGVLAVAGVASTALGLASRATALVDLESGAVPTTGSMALDAAALLLFALGPVLAVWRFDLGEQGMLGDAGANPMGAVAGLLIVAGLPMWALLGYLVLMLALNLASEKVSFSKVIEGNGVLRRLDGLGRSQDS